MKRIISTVTVWRIIMIVSLLLIGYLGGMISLYRVLEETGSCDQYYQWGTK